MELPSKVVYTEQRAGVMTELEIFIWGPKAHGIGVSTGIVRCGSYWGMRMRRKMIRGDKRMRSNQKEWKNIPLGRDSVEFEVLELVEVWVIVRSTVQLAQLAERSWWTAQLNAMLSNFAASKYLFIALFKFTWCSRLHFVPAQDQVLGMFVNYKSLEEDTLVFLWDKFYCSWVHTVEGPFSSCVALNTVLPKWN